jgi:hypothetical protein
MPSDKVNSNVTMESRMKVVKRVFCFPNLSASHPEGMLTSFGRA